MMESIPDELARILRETPALAQAYLVGGSVRDWLLGIPHRAGAGFLWRAGRFEEPCPAPYQRGLCRRSLAGPARDATGLALRFGGDVGNARTLPQHQARLRRTGRRESLRGMVQMGREK